MMVIQHESPPQKLPPNTKGSLYNQIGMAMGGGTAGPTLPIGGQPTYYQIQTSGSGGSGSVTGTTSSNSGSGSGDGVNQNCMSSTMLNGNLGSSSAGSGDAGNGCSVDASCSCSGGDAGDTQFAGDLNFQPTGFNPTSLVNINTTPPVPTGLVPWAYNNNPNIISTDRTNYNNQFCFDALGFPKATC